MVTIVKQFKFNERIAIEKMMKSNFVDTNNIVNTIYSLAKYNYHVLHLKDKANYNRILKYITENCHNIFEENIYTDIEGCIKNAKKHVLVTINEVCITKGELDIIRSLNNIRQEKAIFVILAVTKYFDVLTNKEYDAVFLTNSEICNLARITIPTKERDEFMQFAYDKGLLIRHCWPESTIKKVSFVSRDENDEVVLRLKEEDFKDLAYTYLAYLNPGQFKRCFRCKKWIRNKNKGNQLCKECREQQPEEKDMIKTGNCIDCGKEFYVDVRNMTKCRCDECQSIKDKEMKSVRNARYYENHKIKTVCS